MGRQSKHLVIGLLALLASTWSNMGPAAAFTKSFSYNEISTSLSQALQSLEIYLHNLGPLKDGSFYKPGASSIRLNGKRLSAFSVEPFPVGRVAGRNYFYHVTALQSKTVTVDPADRSFLLTITFSSIETPLIPKCILKAGTSSASECDPYPLPNIALNGVALTARLVPFAHKGSIAFKMTSVQAAGTPDIALCDTFIGGFACNRVAGLPKFTERVRKKVEGMVLATFNTATVYDSTAAKLRDATGESFAYVTGVDLLPDSIVVRGRIRIFDTSF